MPPSPQEAVVRELQRVGLSDYEASVFAVLNEFSPTGAAQIAKKLRLSRSTVYTALERLVAKGLVSTTFQNGVKQFVAQPPSAIEDLLRGEEKNLKERQRAFEQLAPYLSLVRRGDLEVPRIMVFEGQESLKKIYLDMLRAAPQDSTMLIIRDEFVWDKEWSFIFSKEWSEKVRRLRAEHNIATQLLVNDSKREREHQRYYAARKHLEFRFLSKQRAIRDIAIYILGDTVSLLSIEHSNLVGIRITNRNIAENFTQLFSTLWHAAERTGRSGASNERGQVPFPSKARRVLGRKGT